MADTAFFVPPNGKKFLDGVEVRHHIRRRGLRQGDVAGRLRVSDPHFCRFLSARCAVAPETLAALASVLGVPPSSLLLKNGRPRRAS